MILYTLLLWTIYNYTPRRPHVRSLKSVFFKIITISKSLFARCPNRPTVFLRVRRCSSLSLPGHGDQGPHVHRQVLLRHRRRDHFQLRRGLENQGRSRAAVSQTRKMVEFHTDLCVQQRYSADTAVTTKLASTHRTAIFYPPTYYYYYISSYYDGIPTWNSHEIVCNLLLFIIFFFGSPYSSVWVW